MNTTIKTPKTKWYAELLTRCEMLAERHAFPEHIAQDIKQFVLDIAKEQYIAGNRSGIKWAFKKAKENAESI